MIMVVLQELPSGTVTFLFTDVEGSTKLLHELGADAYARALAAHRQVIRQACDRHDGVEVDTQGDALFVAFATAPAALAAATELTESLASGLVRVRVGLHTGTPLLSDEGYVGVDVHRAARIAASGHGGQVLVSQATASLVDGDLRDLGEHRFKDLLAAERVYQLGSRDFPPLRSLGRISLPVATWPILGRERELAEIRRLVAGGARLLTLTGPGGSGKTRLALQAAAELSDEFRDGTFFVALAPLREAHAVRSTVAESVGLQADDDVVGWLASRRVLLVIDNLEHLAGVAAVVAELLVGEVVMVATSRAPLHLSFEHELPVEPLLDDASAELFVSRAAAGGRHIAVDETVRAVCRRLDNLPLAIELAAARTKLLSPAALLQRLAEALPLLAGGPVDLPERQRTLRATIEWSYDLLDADAQAAFRRLSVFRGSFNLDAAKGVAGAELEQLAALLDHSLLKVLRDERFFLLETLREYARERLDESGETDRLRRRHASWFVALAEETAPGLTGPDQASCLERLTDDHDNLRAVLDWAADAGEDELLLRLTGASFRFWYLRSLLGEARTRLETALATRLRAPALRERVLFGASLIAHRQGDAAAARTYATERLDVCRELDDPALTASAFIGVGLAATLEGDHRLAKDAFDRARSYAAEAGDTWADAIATLNLSDIALLEGAPERAATLAAKATRTFRELGDHATVTKALATVGTAALELGELERARSTFEEGLRVAVDLDDSESLIWHLEGLAAIAALQGDLEQAASLAGVSEAVRDETGFAPQSSEQLVLKHVRELVDEKAVQAAHARAGSMTREEAMAYVLESLG
jgi:predicted ATPase/class 3 adenylate cyclase